MFVAAVVGTLLAAGCGSGSSASHAKPLTAAQAQELAAVKFNNFTAGVRSIKATVAGSQRITLVGWVDFVHGDAYTAATDTSSSTALGLIAWDATTIAIREDNSKAPRLPAPTDAWQTATFIPAKSSLNAGLALLLSLAGERADDAVALAQSDARWLRTDTVDGVAVDVFSEATGQTGSSSEYWVSTGGDLLELRSKLSGSHDWSTFTFSAGNGVVVPTIAQLTGA